VTYDNSVRRSNSVSSTGRLSWLSRLEAQDLELAGGQIAPVGRVMRHAAEGSRALEVERRVAPKRRLLAHIPRDSTGINIAPLCGRRRQRAGTLSGGQRKLLAIARALVTRPRALLLDEPSAGLSPQAVELVFDQLAEVKRRGIAIVMVEQNARRALSLADRGYVLDMGRNAYEGTGRSLLDDPKVTDLYLGSTIASSSTSTSAPSGINPPT